MNQVQSSVVSWKPRVLSKFSHEPLSTQMHSKLYVQIQHLDMYKNAHGDMSKVMAMYISRE